VNRIYKQVVSEDTADLAASGLAAAQGVIKKVENFQPNTMIDDVAVPTAQDKQNALQALEAAGVTPEEFDQMTTAFENANAPLNKDFYNFLGNLGFIALSTNSNLQDVFDTSLILFKKTHDLKQTSTCLGYLTELSRSLPGGTIFVIARRAALGQPFANDYALAKFVLTGLKQENFAKSLKLDAVINAIVTGDIAELQNFEPYLDQKLKAQQKQIELILKSAEYQSLIAANAKKDLARMYQSEISNLPEAWQGLMGKLYSNIQAASNAIEKMNLIRRNFGLAQAPQATKTPDVVSPLSGRTSSAYKKNIVMASPDFNAPDANTNTNANWPVNPTDVNTINTNQQAITQGQSIANTSDFEGVNRILQGLNTIADAYKFTKEQAETKYKEIQTMLGTQDISNINAGKSLLTPDVLHEQLKEVSDILTKAQKESINLLNASINLEKDASQYSEELLTRATNRNIPFSAQLSTLMESIKSWNVEIAQMKNNAFLLETISPILMKLALLEPYKANLEESFNLSSKFGNIGVMNVINSYFPVMDSMIALHIQAARKLNDISQKIKNDEGLAQNLHSNAMLQANEAKKLYVTKTDKLATVGALSGGNASMSSGINAINASSEYELSMLRLAQTLDKSERIIEEEVDEETDREADKKYRDYWNDLYQKTPGSPDWGNISENPDQYRGKPSTTHKRIKKRLKKKVNPSNFN